MPKQPGLHLKQHSCKTSFGKLCSVLAQVQTNHEIMSQEAHLWIQIHSAFVLIVLSEAEASTGVYTCDSEGENETSQVTEK